MQGGGSLVEPVTGRRWTPAESERRIAQRLAVYRNGGVARGHRVFLHFGNCLEFFVELLAIWRAGACAVPIDPRFTAFEIETLANWARPRAAVWLGTVDAEAGAALQRQGVELLDATGERGEV